MGDSELSRRDAQKTAQNLLDLGDIVACEYGYQVECSEAKEQARKLYEEFGPFELDFGYTYNEHDWYDPNA